LLLLLLFVIAICCCCLSLIMTRIALAGFAAEMFPVAIYTNLGMARCTPYHVSNLPDNIPVTSKSPRGCCVGSLKREDYLWHPPSSATVRTWGSLLNERGSSSAYSTIAKTTYLHLQLGRNEAPVLTYRMPSR
jgi:hypothetical protein